MNVGKDSLVSKSTTAHTNENYHEEFKNSDSDGEDQNLSAAAPRTVFNIQNETGQREAKSDSN